MKNFVIFVVVFFVAAGIYYFIKPSTPSTSTFQITYCTPTQLDAILNTNVAAGQAYTTLTIKNISAKACDVIGNNQPQVMYPTSVNNFQTQLKSQPIAKVFTLAPGQTIYSLIHFPNGPQCSSEAVDVNAGVSYVISANDTVSFKPITGDTLDIPSCGKKEDITMIDLYSFSDVEVLP